MRPERVLIVGGGLAGCALAESFSRRGVQVLVLERHERLGGAVASLPLIAQHPALTPDFDLRSRLLLRAMQLHASLRAGPARDLQPAFEVCGRLQPMTRERAERCIAHVPPGVACLAGMDDRARLRQATSARQAASAAGGHAGDGCRATAGIDGVFFPECAAVSPRRWWDAVLARPGVECRLGVRVGRIEPQGPDDL
ncbi:MAG: FAD-dependent oxidoreductase, partial [Lautropia sp.]|nr:FAD-dependent oxidoreductase [Lautropia sp.]